MPNNLLTNLRQQLASGLIRRASTECSRWAQNYVVLGKPKAGRLSFRWHPWEKEMMDCVRNWSGRKAAQMGYSNVALCRCIYANDIQKVDVLYLLPKRSPDAADFSKAKFDAILELSPHLHGLYNNTRNIGHKQAGAVNFFIRGARSRSGLKSISTGKQVWDELDEMPHKQLALAIERSSGYDESDTQLIKISTPTLPDFGIDAEIKNTDQSVFVFRCPHCSRFTNLPFPDCLKITGDNLEREAEWKQSYIFCPLCKHKLDHESKADYMSLERGSHWVPTKSGFETRGFLINQYYSTTIAPWKIAESRLKGEFEPSELQEYWNSKGGLPHLPEGARVNDIELTKCIGPHHRTDRPPQGHIITMGVDVGKVLHFWIDQWMLPNNLGADLNMFARCRNLHHGHVDHFEELDTLMRQWQILHAVIDWQPEERKAHEFCQRFNGHAHRCYFPRGTTGKLVRINDADQLVGVSKVAWLDLSQGRFKNQSIVLPEDTSRQVFKHVKNLVRIEKKDSDDNPVSKYIRTGADHLALARMYSEVALPLAVSIQTNQDIGAFL